MYLTENNLPQKLFLPVLIIILSLFFVFTYFKFQTPHFLTFSDGAKFADIAKNLTERKGYVTGFSFFSTGYFKVVGNQLFFAGGSPMATPTVMAVFFKIFGISDRSIFLTSGFFYIFLVLAVYLLGQKLFGKLVGFLSAIAVAADIDFLNYATSGASEVLFSFIAVFSFYLILLKKGWANVLFFVSLVLLYLTRPQGIIFIGVLILTWLLTNFNIKKALIVFTSSIVGIFLLDKLVLYPLSFKYPVYPIVTRGIQALFQYSPTTAVSDALRGGTGIKISYSEIIKKSFYNLYNFYKLLPAIASPYMWGLFAIGLFLWDKRKDQNVFKFSIILLTIGTFLLTALTIPFYRYLHPVIPFVYIIAVATLVEIIGLLIKDYRLLNKSDLTTIYNLLSIILVLFFTVGQTLGVIFLDSRFTNANHNIGQPPVYVRLSYILRDNTNSNQTVVTNLDTWGTWYGERKTVWFPLEPNQLIDPSTGKIPFDAIYLTSYLINDQNYYMGTDWREIFENPTDSKKWICDGCAEIAKEFKLKGVYKVSASEDYEKLDASAILLVRK